MVPPRKRGAGDHLAVWAKAGLKIKPSCPKSGEDRVRLDQRSGAITA
jgi:hypothetical protein